MTKSIRLSLCLLAAAALALGACADVETLPTATADGAKFQSDYHIGPDDNLQIFVWRNPELSISVPVRPDGRISVPLIEDLPVTGKTPTELARDIEKKLGVYVQDPIVTVIVTRFRGPYGDQIRVIGEAAQPHGVP